MLYVRKPNYSGRLLPRTSIAIAYSHTQIKEPQQFSKLYVKTCLFVNTLCFLTICFYYGYNLMDTII